MTTGSVPQSVQEYCERRFDAGRLPPSPALPLPEESHVRDWRGYAAEVSANGFAALQARLCQLRVPIRHGISSSDVYADVVRRGRPFDETRMGGTLSLCDPRGLRLSIHEHPAGALPVISVSERADFETLVRALAYRSEPATVPSAVNAQMVSGLTNWDRVGRYRAQWGGADEDWPAELQRVAAHEPWRFKDRIILAAAAPYSGVSAAALGLDLDETSWVEASLGIRIEHEFAHYATKRLYGEMRVHVLDELIADWMGFTMGLGTFRARWCLACFGLERWPLVRPEGRVAAYRGDLDDEAFHAVCESTVRAAAALERSTLRRYRAEQRDRFFLALTGTTLGDLAAPDAEARFDVAYERSGLLVGAVTRPRADSRGRLP